MESTRTQKSTQPQIQNSSTLGTQLTAKSQALVDRYTNSTARSANAAPQASNQLSSASRQNLHLSKQVSSSSNCDQMGAMSKGQQPTPSSSNKNFYSSLSKTSGMAVGHLPKASSSNQNNAGGPMTLQVPASSATAGNRVGQVQGSEPDPSSGNSNDPKAGVQEQHKASDPGMAQLEVEPTSPKTFIVPLPSSQKSQISNREPVSQSKIENKQSNPVSIRDLQKINIHDFQNQQGLVSSTQNKIINKMRKGQVPVDDGHHENGGGSTFTQGKNLMKPHTQSVQDEYLFNQTNNYDTLNGPATSMAPTNDLKQLDNFMREQIPSQIKDRSRQPIQQQDSNSNQTASSSIIKHAKSLYQFIVPVAQLNLNVNSNTSANQVGEGGGQQVMNEGGSNGIQQTINNFIQNQADQQQNAHQQQNQDPFVFDRAEIAMQQQRLPRSQAQGAGQGRFAMLNMGGGRQLSGYIGEVGSNKDHQHYQQMRERSSNNPRLIGSLGGPAANTIHRRDFSSNTHNSGSGQQQQFNTFNRMQHDRSAGQFAQIDSLTNYEPSQSIFSGQGGGHPAVVHNSGLMNNPAPRFGGLMNSFHVTPFNEGINYLNNQSYHQGLLLSEPQQSITSTIPGGKQNIFATQNQQRIILPQADAYDSRSQQVVNQSADHYMDHQMQSIGLNQGRGGAREMSNPVRMSERDGMAQLQGKPCRTQRDYPMPGSQALATDRSQLLVDPQLRHVDGQMSYDDNMLTLTAIVHYVKINIPQSIRMQVQGVFSQQNTAEPTPKNLQKEKSTTTNSSKAGSDQQQVVITKNKCRIDSVQTVQQKGPGDVAAKEVTIKKANFHDQKLKIQLKMNPMTQKIQQKLTMKLLAVNNDQTKLIGLLHYTFMPNLDDFKKLDNALLKFQRSIDNDACVCVSTVLHPSQAAPTPGAEYGGKLGHRLFHQQNYQFNPSKNQTYDTMSQLVGNDGYFQRPIRKFEKGSTDVRNVDFSKADDMGVDTLHGEGEGDDVDEAAEPERNTSNLQINDVSSPHESKEAQSTTSQHRGGQTKHIESSKKPTMGINFIQNSSAKMKLPPAAPTKTPNDRAKTNSLVQDIAGSGQSQAARAQQSHSSSFVTDKKPLSKDYKEDTSKNMFIAADEEGGDDQSITMTTFHNVTGMIDGAFKEEENEPCLSQSINLNNVLKSSQDAEEKAAQMLQADQNDGGDGGLPNQNQQNQLRPNDHKPSAVANKPADEENINDDLATKMLESKINDFDLSKVDGEDGAPSDSEQQYNRNSVSNSPTRNRKPIQNSQPKTNLQVDFAHVRATDPKLKNNKSALHANRNQNLTNVVQTPNRHQSTTMNDSQKKRDNSQDVRSTLKSTFNILYNKLQVGVITTINHALEERSNQGGGQHMNSRQQMLNGMEGPFTKRSQSSQAPFVRGPGNFNHDVQNPRIMQGQHGQYHDLEMPLTFENHTNQQLRSKNFQQQNSALPPAHNQLQRRTFQSPRGGPPPPGMPRDAKMANKFQNINQQNLNNEVVILRQEKSFLTQRLQQQEDQHAMQIESLKDKIESQEKRVEKREQKLQKLLDDIKELIPEKIQDVEAQQDEADKSSKKDQQYEKILALFQRQNNVIQMMSDKMKIIEQDNKEKEEQNTALQKELDALKEKVENDNKVKQNEQAAYQEEREAQKFKMTVQIEQIEGLTKEKMENDELIKVQDRLVVEQESKIKELEKQLNELKAEKDELKKQIEGDSNSKTKEVEKQKREIDSLKLKLEQKAKDVGDLEDDRVLYKESEEQLKRQIKSLNDNNLQNEKIQFKLKHDIDQHLNTIDKLKKDLSQLKQEREEMMEHNREVAEALKLTEFQLIQAKSSWAESECEREQLFNRVQELEDKFDVTSKKSYQSRKE